MPAPVRPRRRVLPAVGLIGLAVVVAILVGFALQPRSAPAAAPGKPFRPVTGLVKPSQPSSLWVGDSYTAGTGASDQAHAESCLTAAAMGWVCNVDAEGGTGFTANGHVNSRTFRPLPKRLAGDREQYLADVILVDAGRNDPSTSATVTAARRYLTALRTARPQARLVLIDPYFMRSTSEPNPALDAFYRSEAAQLHAVVIDPIGEGWINHRSAHLVISADHLHPNPAGHRYIAAHLTYDLRRLGLSNLPVTDLPQ